MRLIWYLTTTCGNERGGIIMELYTNSTRSSAIWGISIIHSPMIPFRGFCNQWFIIIIICTRSGVGLYVRLQETRKILQNLRKSHSIRFNEFSRFNEEKNRKLKFNKKLETREIDTQHRSEIVSRIYFKEFNHFSYISSDIVLNSSSLSPLVVPLFRCNFACFDENTIFFFHFFLFPFRHSFCLLDGGWWVGVSLSSVYQQDLRNHENHQDHWLERKRRKAKKFNFLNWILKLILFCSAFPLS